VRCRPAAPPPIQSNSAFSDLNYAIYRGVSTRPADLLVASVARLPLQGRTAVRTIPFGDSAFTLVMSPRRPLGGRLPQELPWIFAVAGVLLSLGAAALTVGLTRRRRAAQRLASDLEQVAGENRRLYAEQRSIAQTLQHALLPAELPQVPGVEAGARFEPGQRGVEVGGDWYDVIELDDWRLLLVVSIGSGGRLATVLCALVDVGQRELTVTSAGHLPPLLISDGRTEYV
jgi:hypothetical protein